jgi:hypothetical protein
MDDKSLAIDPIPFLGVPKTKNFIQKKSNYYSSGILLPLCIFVLLERRTTDGPLFFVHFLNMNNLPKRHISTAANPTIFLHIFFLLSPQPLFIPLWPPLLMLWHIYYKCATSRAKKLIYSKF